MNITLQPAKSDDLPLILPMVAAYHEFEKLGTTASERESAVNKLLSTPEVGGIWLIFMEHACVGYLALCRGFSIEFNGFDGFIDEFFIKAEYRGKGIGKNVLQAIKTEARKLEIKALHLEVARDNHPAQSLYRKAGFSGRDKYLIMSLEIECD